ncbi:AbrB/MazE/SpoVT family DNA-binding domain-containing protein [Oceanobacillus oncorhynchi]|uniref:AbrB/MazE/SpoVT family DNA-binding domain-containing protein n=1 Tax=Oceanobacillus oncorhynchi TaxID=545501 RepID=UPI0018678EB0|nr:AbrB/MazE/SpoVT family DNA-binding domain-containing protein [Oceanobacillus oncorhynchi]
MKSTGVTRKVDILGRVVIPKELRDTLDVRIKDSMEILLDEDKVVFRKYQATNACMVTGKVADDNVTLADGSIVLAKDVLEKIYHELQTKFVLENKI